MFGPRPSNPEVKNDDILKTYGLLGKSWIHRNHATSLNFVSKIYQGGKEELNVTLPIPKKLSKKNTAILPAINLEQLQYTSYLTSEVVKQFIEVVPESNLELKKLLKQGKFSFSLTSRLIVLEKKMTRKNNKKAKKEDKQDKPEWYITLRYSTYY